MKAFSRINWAAYFLGGFLWALFNKLWFWAAGLFILSFLATMAESLNRGVYGPAITLDVLFYIPMLIVVAYLAVNGNRMLKKRITEKKLAPEDELLERVATYKRQQTQVLFGVAIRILFYLPLVVLPITLAIDGDFGGLIMLTTVVGIELVAVGIIVGIAALRGDERDEICQPHEVEHVEQLEAIQEATVDDQWGAFDTEGDR